MKLFSLVLLVILLLPSLYAFQAHNQNIEYKHPAIVVKDGVSYISLKDVPAGTIIDSSDFWTTLLGTAPSSDPGDPPASEPTDSNFSNLTPPEDDDYVRGDLDSDGIPDIIWQKSGTSDVKFWFMNTDGSIKDELDLDHGASVDWTVSSMGDMNNDGNTDILWQHNDGSTVFRYHMDGTGKVDSGKSLASGVIPGWRFVSASDFNRDGDVDFLWHSTAQGSTVCWHFDGEGVVNGFSPLGSGIVDFFISYSGNDMNADSYSDVIYQSINSGQVLVWYFDDKKNILGTKNYIRSMSPVLRVAGAYDYNNDNAVDLLFQNDSTGEAKIVYFDTSGTQLSEKEIGTIGSNWKIRN